MNINQINYEEFFLLYADNELSDAERKEVEAFVKQFPQYETELNALMLTIQQPDEEHVLNDKSFLFKKESNHFINEKNFEEKFVLYHDGELTNEERAETEEFLKTNPGLQHEFDLIQKVKLFPDTSIVFPGKASLYRHPTKVFAIRFYKMAAAAAVLGFVIWLGYPGEIQKSPQQTIASNQQIVEKPGAVKPSPVVPSPTTAQEDVIDEETPASNKVEKTVARKEEPRREQNEEQEKENILPTNEVQAPEQELTAIVTELPLPDKSTSIESTKTLSFTDTDLTPKSTLKENENIYANTDTRQDELLGIPIGQIKRSKVGGFIKQVSRVIERNNPIHRLLDGNE